jgi:hypothetical protein
MCQSANFARRGALVLAALVGLQALWLLAADVVRPKLPFFPADKETAEAISAQSRRAALSASIGFLRADQWADYALTLASGPLFELTAGPTAPIEYVRATTERAIALGPHDPRVWLLSAAIEARLAGLKRNLLGPLKMSYYTGPNEGLLIPTRLMIASGSNAIADPELEILVSSELRTIVMHRPDLRPAVLAAYREASPEGKRLIEDTVTELDAALAGELRADHPSR